MAAKESRAASNASLFMLPEQWKEDRRTGCQIWTARSDEKGYPRVDIAGRHRRPTRILYERVNGPIPPGFDVHHTCGIKSCCNVDHMILMSESEHGRLHKPRKRGLRIRISMGNKDKTHCKRGHALEGANLLVRRDGRGRECRTCNQWHQQRYRALPKAAGKPGVEVGAY